MKTQWWKKAVVYQIYPRSFCDSNGDGIGDINGITSKLGYIKELGVDVIWLSPIYKSPMFDNGYDISDYCAINPEFGTMKDFDHLLEQAHGLGLKIIMDLVVNHSSNEHPWFLESKTNLDNPKRDYYIWQEGVRGGPPNDWKAYFGGSTWTYDETTGQYYLNCFSPHQPDLNWENPDLRREIHNIMRWWLDKGIDGFRLDAISLISKPLADGSLNFPNGEMKEFIFHGPRIHEYIKEMRSEVLKHYDVMTVGETGGVRPEHAVIYANADGSELDMVFQFEQVELDGSETFKWTDQNINLVELKEVLTRWQNQLFDHAWNSLYWCNHDQPRIVSRLGDSGALREKSAKMLATCLHFMQGTPFIYQGEELGMLNYPFKDISEYRDLESINAYNALVLEEKRIAKEDMLRFMALKSRDNSRTPMQWNEKPNAGFSAGKPWINVNPNYSEINAEDQIHREDSVYKYYQKLIQFRKTMDIITHGDFQLLMSEHPDLFVYMRKFNNEMLLVTCNFSYEERIVTLPEGFKTGKILITNDETQVSNESRVLTAEIVLSAFGALVLTNQ